MVSPQSVRGQEERHNVERAVEHVAAAAAKGAQFVCFPEGYPGPYNGPVDYSPLPALSQAARDHGVHVIAGLVEAAEDLGPDIYRLSFKLIDPAGEVIGSHSRVLPNPKEMNEFLMGGKCIAPGDSLEVFETEHCRVGILVCSEAWSPELPLIMALKGADVLFAPIGGAVYELHDHWQTILKARAYENTMYVATCQNLWGMEDSMGLIVGPDGVVAESTAPGELIGDLDIDRLAVLREQTQDLKIPKPYRSIPGMLKHRRPDLYDEIVAPREDLYDFFYFRERVS
jgi:predicted amidohydrolase